MDDLQHNKGLELYTDFFSFHGADMQICKHVAHTRFIITQTPCYCLMSELKLNLYFKMLGFVFLKCYI